MTASQDIQNFMIAALVGIVGHRDEVRVEVIQSGSKTITTVLHCAPEDMETVIAKMRSIKHIAIGIAQRHRVIVNVILNQ